jgi:energy-coupling factor transporter ATP-binding protein EcfA2
VLQRFFPTDAPRPAVHLVGTSGSGKSEIASLLSSFYGQFSRDTPPAQWGDTINTVETLGYPLADTIFWVNNYRASMLTKRPSPVFCSPTHAAWDAGG